MYEEMRYIPPKDLEIKKHCISPQLITKIYILRLLVGQNCPLSLITSATSIVKGHRGKN